MTVQNEKTALEDVQPVIDENIANTVHEIFSAVLELNPLQDLFEDLAKRLIDDLAANSLLDYNLELKEDQKKQLTSACRNKGHEVVSMYLSNLNVDERTKEVYGVCREKTTGIVDAILSSIGREINRGALINARAVQANSKNPKYDEILLRKTKAAGDITVPTSVVMISTNCVEIIKSSCQEVKPETEEDKGGQDEPEQEKAVADKPVKRGKGKKMILWAVGETGITPALQAGVAGPTPAVSRRLKGTMFSPPKSENTLPAGQIDRGFWECVPQNGMAAA